MITNSTAWLLVEACRVLDRPARGLVVVDLGGQNTAGHLVSRSCNVWEWLGAQYHAIDLNGAGAVALDLSQPVPGEWRARADVVTNFGTSEHVCTSHDFYDQWQVFRNMHEIAKPRAVLLHSVPGPDGAHGGCGYVYGREFLASLAAVCRYQVIHAFEPESDAKHIAGLLLKDEEIPFPAFDEWRAAVEIFRTQTK